MNSAKLAEPLDIGGVTIRNRVFLAPMSGITDAGLPHARPCAWRRAGRLRDGGQRRTRQRAAGHRTAASAIPACRSTWCSLPGARRITWRRRRAIAAGEGADIIDINMGCPAKKVTGGYSGSALMRDLDHALTLIDAVVGAVDVPGHGQDAARLGRDRAQRADAGAPRRAGGRQDGDGPRPHALPVLSGQGRLARDRARQGSGVDPRRRQWRCRFAARTPRRSSSSPAPTR